MEPDIFINRLLDALQRQDVVAPGIRDPLRRVPLTIIAWAGNIMPTPSRRSMIASIAVILFDLPSSRTLPSVWRAGDQRVGDAQ